MEKKLTGRLIAASSAESADLLYACGFQAADEFVYFEVPELRGVAVSILELSRARKEVASGVQVFNRADIFRTLPPGETHRDFLVALSRHFGISSWIVPDRFPLCHAETLRAAGIEVKLEKGDFFPGRVRKTPQEIECIRESMRATENAMRQVEAFLRESSVNTRGELELKGKILTCEFIRSEIEAEFKRAGYTAFHTIIACGSDSSAPHRIGQGPVLANRPLVADIFPRSDSTGYWGDMTRTFVKGKAEPIVRKAFDAVKKASETVLEHLAPGIPGILAHQLAAKTMEEAGFKTGHDAHGNPCGFIHGLGHGVGLEIHENPRLSPGNPNPLEAGNVVSVEPGLYNPAWGGIRLEDLVVLTEKGYENFCTMPKELEVP